MGGPWEQYAGPASSEQGPWTRYEKQEPTSKTESAVRGTVQGATFGFSDEIYAGVGSGFGLVGDYDEMVGNERGRNEAAQESNPLTYLSGEIGGGMLPAIASLGGSAPLTVANAAKVGFTAGAAYSAGTAEGDVIDRIDDAAIGGATGLIGGVAGHGLVKGAGAVVNKLAKGKQGRAANMVSKALSDDGITPERAAKRIEQAHAEGTPMMLADVGEDNMRGLAAAVGNKPGPAREKINRAFTRRNAEQADRISQAAQKGLGTVDEGVNNVSETIIRRAMQADPLYKKAYASKFDIPPNVERILERPSAQAAYRRGQKLAVDAGLDPTNPVIALDYTKRSLDDAIGVAKRQGQKEKVRVLTNTKNLIIKPLKKANPAYAEALDAYSSDSALLDAYELGAKVLRGKTGDTMKQFAGMSEAERNFARYGLIEQLQEAIEKAPDAADLVKRVFGSPAKRTILKTAFPDEKSFRKFQTTIMREMKMRKTRDVTQVGSRTAPLQSDMQAMANAADVATDVATGAPVSMLRSIIRKVSGNREIDLEVAKIVSDLVVTKDGGVVREALSGRGTPLQITVGAPAIGVSSGAAAGERANKLIERR